MPIDVAQALAADPLAHEFSWTPADVQRYNVGLGVGTAVRAGADDRDYLADEPTVLPSFAVVPVTPLIARYNDIPGIDVAGSSVLHGEHKLRIFRPSESWGALRNTMAATRVVDKGSAALIVATIDSFDTADNSLVARHEVSYFVRGEGGVGETVERQAPEPGPDRRPDYVVRHRTASNQALVFSLSGDRNPVHTDPAAAQAAGLEGPILQGLCTYGIACKAVVDAVLGGDPTMVISYDARFTGLVYPGQTVAVSIWDEPGGLVLEVDVVETSALVLRGRMITTKHGT